MNGSVQFRIKSVDIDTQGIIDGIDKRMVQCQRVLDAQVLKDSNKYCPLQNGTLQKSGILSTVLGSGLVRWNTPYAAAQYYMYPNKSHQRNSQASMKWFEVAKSKRLKVWEKLVNDKYTQNS